MKTMIQRLNSMYLTEVQRDIIRKFSRRTSVAVSNNPELGAYNSCVYNSLEVEKCGDVIYDSFGITYIVYSEYRITVMSYSTNTGTTIYYMHNVKYSELDTAIYLVIKTTYNALLTDLQIMSPDISEQYTQID